MACISDRLIAVAVFTLLVSSVAAQGFPTLAVLTNYTCSATQGCALGCCGKEGFCGFGPTFCGQDNCTANCDRKSECDPGWGAAWSNATDCPLNVCCSQYGFCGTTREFCGNETVQSPSCATDGNTAKQRVVGYYEAWSIQRNCDQIFPSELYQGAWTHLNFAFVYIDPVYFEVVPMDPRDTQLYTEFTDLKKLYPNLQTWISVGGWAMNDPGPWNTTFSDLAASAQAQEQFADSIIAFMRQYGFDGVDIDWEYPVAEERAGRPEDLENFVTWMAQLQARLNGEFGLTITVPSSYWYMRHFDIISLSEIVDWMNIMTYDLHGTWDASNPYVGPYLNSHTNLTEINQALELLWRNDIPPEKVSLGLGFYGRSFTLADPSCSSPGCVWTAGGRAGPCTNNVGTLSFSEIEEVIANSSTDAIVTYNTEAAVEQVVFDGDQWVSHDDAVAFSDKFAFANSRCLGGLLVWAASLDNAVGAAHADLCEAIGCEIYRVGNNTRPILCGSTTQCRRYHTAVQYDTCYTIGIGAGLTFVQLQALNPPIDASCSNLQVGYRYCVDGIAETPDYSTCTTSAPATRSTTWISVACPTPTSREL